MKKADKHVLVVQGGATPTVEIDTEAAAVYVRFKKAKVKKTLRHNSKWPLVTIDLDEGGNVIGVEFIGVKKFNVNYLMKMIPVKTPSASMLGRAQYIAPVAA
jgi:uncharacterized protein YuzE